MTSGMVVTGGVVLGWLEFGEIVAAPFCRPALPNTSKPAATAAVTMHSSQTAGLVLRGRSRSIRIRRSFLVYVVNESGDRGGADPSAVVLVANLPATWDTQQ